MKKLTKYGGIGLLGGLMIVGGGSGDTLIQDQRYTTIQSIKSEEIKELADSLSIIDYLNCPQRLPKGPKIDLDMYRSGQYGKIIRTPKFIGEILQSKNETAGIDKTIEMIKSLELAAKLCKNIERQKELHDKLIRLYVKKMKGIEFAHDDPVKRKFFFEKMSSDEIEAYAKIHKNKIFELHSRDPDTRNVSNTDDFRKYLGEDIGVSADDTQAAASNLSSEYFDYLLEHNIGVGNNTIKFLAGGAGSGKSSISAFPESNNSNFSGVYDGTFKSHERAEQLIQKVIEKGYRVRVEFVYRDMTESFIHGVLERTIKQNQYYKAQGKGDYLGRTVPLHKFEEGHKGSRKTILKLYEKYGRDVVKFFGGLYDDLQVGDGILDKAAAVPGKGPKFIYEYDIEYIKEKFKEDELDVEKCKLAVEEALLKGEISAAQKKALLGKYL